MASATAGTPRPTRIAAASATNLRENTTSSLPARRKASVSGDGDGDGDGEPITDFFALDPRGVVEHSFHDPDRFFVDPATLGPEQIATQQANMASLRAIAGDPYMHDPSLRDRLAEVDIPALVIWGDSDRIVTPAYGRAYAATLPSATFELIADAGHLPQIEQPAATLALIDTYAAQRGG